MYTAKTKKDEMHYVQPINSQESFEKIGENKETLKDLLKNIHMLVLEDKETKARQIATSPFKVVVEKKKKTFLGIALKETLYSWCGIETYVALEKNLHNYSGAYTDFNVFINEIIADISKGISPWYESKTDAIIGANEIRYEIANATKLIKTLTRSNKEISYKYDIEVASLYDIMMEIDENTNRHLEQSELDHLTNQAG